ncbi:CLIP domain-containing serine protease 2-like [Aricia agestis]|uniref:CLIP domain-containing serine protease 2-like n=1 Tax=Aricia agestis TaxID=91739 RepID=UPI001C208E4F|nr:CLIP domain-containing serine protease 2-like [Aricia agestis]
MMKYILVCILVSARGHQANGADPEVHPNAGLLPDACGEIAERRLAEGPAAGLYEFPWMALISYDTKHGRDFKCTGTIINSRYILTAANCIKNLKIAGVRVGEYNKCTSIDCQLDQCESHIQDITVDEAIVHEDFTSQANVDNNIGLLRLHDPIDFTFKNVAPICLPVSNALSSVTIDGKTATLASWKFRKTSSCALNKISLPLVTRDECIKKHETSSFVKLEISVNQICADEKAEDACGIVSGDPLMLEAGDQGGRRMVQYGLSSHGLTRCGTDYPGIYTDVSKYMDWILSNLKQ